MNKPKSILMILVYKQLCQQGKGGEDTGFRKDLYLFTINKGILFP